MTTYPTVLAALLEDRGLDRYGSFCAAYQKAARALDKQLARSVPSRAQFHRWLTGELRRLPYTDHCRVLEHMLAGYSAAAAVHSLPGRHPPCSCPRQAGGQRGTGRPPRLARPPDMAGVVAVFPSRSEFAAKVDPQHPVRQRPAGPCGRAVAQPDLPASPRPVPAANGSPMAAN